MPSERVQRQIDRLLDEAEQAIAAGDWDLVRLRAESVLRLDRANEAATEYLAADDLERRYDTAPDPPVQWGQFPNAFGLGHLDLVRGRVDDAERRFTDALAWTRREGCPVPEGRCLQALAMVAERRGDHTTALEHLEAAGTLFAEHGITYHLDQVLAAKEILKA